MPINKMEKSIGTIILAFLAGIAYRMGGSGNFPRWVREVGVGACLVLELLLLGLFNWGSLLILGSVWIETTYFKKKGADAMWWNWVLVNISFSVALLPWFIWGWVVNHKPVHWLGYSLRTGVCTVLGVLWQQVLSAKVASALKIGKDVTDEVGRGAIQILTMPLLLL